MQLNVNTNSSGLSTAAASKPFPQGIVKIKALPNQKIELIVDGVKQNGSQLINGKPVTVKKVGADLLFEVDGQTFAQIEDFEGTAGASLDGANWSFPNDGGLAISDAGLVASSAIEPQALPLVAAAGTGGVGVALAGLAAIGLAAGGGGGGDSSAQSIALALIEAYNNGNGTTPAAPTSQDYADAGVTGVTADNLAAVNAQVLKQSTGGADTQAEVQALVTAANTALAKIEAYNNGNGTTPSALTLQDFADAGITGVSADNLAAVNAQVLKQATNGANASPEIQILVTAANAAIAKISAAAQNNTAASLTLADYADIGALQISSSNLASINDALNSFNVNGQSTNTVPKVQIVVDAFVVILAEANGAAADATPGVNPSVAEYAAIGANIGAATTDTENLSLLNDIIGAKSSSGVDTVTKIDVLARIANTVAGQAAGASGLSMADLSAIGITGVSGLSAVNVQNVLNAINGTADNGTGVDTLAKIQALVNSSVDLTPPATPATAPASYADNVGSLQLAASTAAATDDTTPGVNVGIGLTDSPSLYVDGAKVAATYNATTGTLTPVVALADGAHALSYTLTDAAGNESGNSPARNITVDTVVQAPGLRLANDTGNNTTDGLTNLATVNVIGLEPGATWQYEVNGNGTWINGADTSFNLSSGAHGYAVRQTDMAGNTSSPSASADFALDTVAPTVLITDNRSGTLNAAGGNITYTFTFSEPVTDFTAADITVAHGSKGAFTILSPASYSLVVIPQADFEGNVTVDVSAAVVADLAGNSNAVAVQNVQAIDTLVPASPFINPVSSDNFVNAMEATLGGFISGTGEAGSTVTLSSVSGIVLAGGYTALVLADNTWQIQITPADVAAISQGEKVFTATQTDVNGNVSGVSNIRSVIIDTLIAKPSVALANDTGSALHDNVTKDASLALSAPAETVNREFSMDGGTTWTVAYTRPTLAGNYTLLVRDTDVAGNSATSDLLSFELQTAVAKPTVALTHDTANGMDNTDLITSNAALTISTPAFKSLRSVTINGGAATQNYTQPTTDGVYTVLVTDNDLAGNTNQASISFKRDTTADLGNDLKVTVSDTLISNAEKTAVAYAVLGLDTDATATVTFTDTAGHTVTGVNGMADLSTLDAGLITVSVEAVDTAGNTASGPAHSLTLDTSADLGTPLSVSVSDTLINNAEKTHVAYTVLGLDTDATATVTFTDSLGAHAYGDNSSHLVDLSGLADGLITVAITAKDTAGNTATGTGASQTLDTVVAVPTINAVTSDNIINASEVTTTITGTNEAGATVALTLGAGNVRAATVTGTTWSYTLVAADITAMGEGSETLSATQTDAAGNVSTPFNKGITVDTVGPTASITMSNYVLHQSTSDTASVTVTFNEAVSGFAAADVTAPSGTLGAFTSTDFINWTATFTTAPLGGITVNQPSNVMDLVGVYTDLAGNTGNIAHSSNYQVFVT
jgi:hypothetical protein